MKEFQNNAFFWQKIDTICLSGDYIESRKKGDCHPKYPNLIYPASYGRLRFLANEEESLFRCFKGKDGSDVIGIVVCADILQKDIEAKLLIGTDEDDIENILQFLNQTDFQKTILIRRGNAIPSWAQTE